MFWVGNTAAAIGKYFSSHFIFSYFKHPRFCDYFRQSSKEWLKNCGFSILGMGNVFSIEQKHLLSLDKQTLKFISVTNLM